jgi:hypothetical protein
VGAVSPSALQDAAGVDFAQNPIRLPGGQGKSEKAGCLFGFV